MDIVEQTCWKLETFFQVGLFLGSHCSIVFFLLSCLQGKPFDVSAVMKNSVVFFFFNFNNHVISDGIMSLVAVKLCRQLQSTIAVSTE